MPSLLEQLNSLNSGAVLFDLSSSPIFKMAGPDAVRYLHGRITQDVKSLKPGNSVRSLVLTPQGRIQGHFQLLNLGDELLVIPDPLNDQEQSEFIQALLQFKVADQLTLTLSNLSLLALVGAASQECLLELGLAVPSMKNELLKSQLLGEEIIVINQPSSGETLAVPAESVPGFEILVPQAKRSELLSRLTSNRQLLIGSEEGYEALRVIAGRPRWGMELSEKILGPEIPVTELVSFNKGCYAGQEVVEMATARGRPNRQLLRFSANTKDLPVQALLGKELHLAEGDSTTAVGQVTSIATLPERTRLLAFVKTSAAELNLTCNGIPLTRL